MKKLYTLLLVIVIISGMLSGCGSTNSTTSDSSKSNSVSIEDNYQDAVELIKKREYASAIELLEKNENHSASEELLGKVHYVYGSQLFNEKDFTGAYSHFQESSGYSDIDKRKSMVDYYGGIYLTNNGEYSSACTYFKRAVDSDYVQEAVKHVSELTKNLLSGGWIGSCVVNGNTFQVQMTYSKSSNNFSLVWADRSNGGYKHVTDMDYGTLSVVGSRNAFYYEGDFYTVEFDFNSSTSVRVKWSDSQLNGMAGGIFKRDYAAVFEYKIPSIVYPTMTIPDLFSDSTNSSEQNIAIDSSSQVETEVGSNDTTSTTSQTGNSDNTPSTSQSSTPNNSSSSDVQSSEPNNSSTEQHIHNFTINATCEQPAKCECGETSGLATGHNWEYATCETPDTCKNCGKTEGSPIGHDWEEATCTTPKKCEICDKKEGKALDHKYNSDKTVVCQECEEFRSNADSLIKSIPIKILESDDTYIVTQSITSAAITDYYNPSQEYFEVEIKVKGKYLLTFNGGGCTFYAFDKSNNKIATQRINTGGGSEGSEFACKATLTLPTDIDGITLAVE